MPADLVSAYNLDTSQDPGVTIALSSAYGYSTAESDLAVYRSQFGLPACSVASGCLTIVNQEGNVSPQPGPPPEDDDWTVEAALMLQMASATCPKCKLLLINANQDSDNGLYIIQQVAATLGATVMVDGWGGQEDPSVVSTDSTYFDVPGLTIFAAMGEGETPEETPIYPATSPHVIAVGGTTLTTSSNARGWEETAWAGGGTGCSAYFSKPSYQGDTGCGMRATADISAVADPNTGVAVYASSIGGWNVIGGPSSAAIAAGIYALTGRAGEGAAFAYAHPEDFYDITTGHLTPCSGALCQADAGWDGPTGIGTPNGRAMQVTPDAGTPDAGSPDGGSTLGSTVPPASSGGGCSSTGGSPCLAMLLCLALCLRRRPPLSR